jgi:putative FmdB family regulatory protein
MPVYEYRCEACGEQFELVQRVSARAEDTTCPHCQAKKATRLLSAFASKVVGTHKPGFAEDKAYNMLNSRMEKFSKLPPMWGKRLTPSPDLFSNSPASSKPSGDGESTS